MLVGCWLDFQGMVHTGPIFYFHLFSLLWCSPIRASIISPSAMRKSPKLTTPVCTYAHGFWDFVFLSTCSSFCWFFEHEQVWRSFDIKIVDFVENMHVWFNNICNEHHPFWLLQTILVINDRSSKTQNIIRVWLFSIYINVEITTYILKTLEPTYPIQRKLGRWVSFLTWVGYVLVPTIGTNPNSPLPVGRITDLKHSTGYLKVGGGWIFDQARVDWGSGCWPCWPRCCMNVWNI